MDFFKKLLKLYMIFFKVGILTIGGGYAMLPILERELAEDKNLLDMESILESYSLSQTLPGVVASNASTMIGYKLYGIPGAVAAALGVITPSIIIITFIAIAYKRIGHLEVVQKIFRGIRVVVLALLLDSFTRLFKMAVFDKKTFAVMVLAFGVVFFDLVSPLLVIVIGAFFGIYAYRERVGS